MSNFEFIKGDAEPFEGKQRRLDLFRASFGSKSTLSGKLQKHGKSLNTIGRHKRNSLRKRSRKGMHQENACGQETSDNWSSSGSDKIEADVPDLESSQDMRRQLEIRLGGAHEVSSAFHDACKDEAFEAAENREVVIDGAELMFLQNLYTSPTFIFTPGAVALKIQTAGFEFVVEWPLHMIEGFRSYFDEEEGIGFIELDLTEGGIEIFRKDLEGLIESNIYWSYSTLSCSATGIHFNEDIKQITSLSDGYKSLWRRGKEDVKERFQRSFSMCLERIHHERQDLCNRENQDMLVHDIAQDRNRPSLDDWVDLVFPTKEDHDAVTVTKYDFLLLSPDEFISDTIVDFYIKYIQSLLSNDEKKRVYFYNSFFFRKLTEMDKNAQHVHEKTKSSFERVKRWTAGVNIFEKDYLFIPIMQCAHWSLVIVCHPGFLLAGCHAACDWKGPLILHFDSLEGCHSSIEEPIRNYLLEAWNEKNSHSQELNRHSDLKFVAKKVPQQTNYSDCGLFLLHYVEMFIMELRKGGSLEFITDEWFKPADASGKRKMIQSLVKQLNAREKARESGGSAGKSHRHLASNFMENMENPDGVLLSQRSAAFQACNLFSPKPQQHDYDVKVSTYSSLDQDCSELGLDHVCTDGGELQQCFCLIPQQPPCCEHPMVSHFLQQQAIHDGPYIPVVFSDGTCAEENPSVHVHDSDLGNDLPDCTVFNEHFMDCQGAGNPSAESADINMTERNLATSESASLENMSVEAKFNHEVAFCVPYDKTRMFDMAIYSPLNGLQKGRESHGDIKNFDRDRVGEQGGKKVNSEVIRGAHDFDVSNLKLMDSQFGSGGAADDHLEGKEAACLISEDLGWSLPNALDGWKATDREDKGDADLLEVKEVARLDSIDVRTRDNIICQGKDVECIVFEGGNKRLKDQVEANNKHRVLENVEEHLEISLSILANLSGNRSRCKEVSVGLDRMHCISSDEELTPKVAEVGRMRKRGRPSCKSAQVQSERVLAHAGRRLTRSTLKASPVGRKKSVMEAI